jgi:Icc-related predicted phosphoesterase
VKFSVIGDLHGCAIYLRYLRKKISKTDALFITGDIAGTLSYRLILKSILLNRKISRGKYAELVYGKYLEKFVKFQKKTTKRILRILSKTNTQVFFTHGNSDSDEILEFFKEYSENNTTFHYLGNSTIKHNNLIIAGYGYCSPAEFRTPFQTPGEKSKKEISDDLSLLEKQLLENKKEDKDYIIGLFHEPPKNTQLDFIDWKSSHSGSDLILNHIQKVPYDLILAGHIHESQNYEKQNSRILLNPGPLVDRKWAVVDLSNQTVSLRKIPFILSIKGFIYRTRETFK